jgi:integrase
MTATPAMVAHAHEYLAFRRALGFTLETSGQEVLLFARWADRTGHTGPLTTELIVRWAQQTRRCSPPYWAWRFRAVRDFARHRAQSDPQTEVPPADLLGPTFRRRQPHIYSLAEITALLAAARTLRRGLRPHTYAALFGLLIATGLRVGEALALRHADVDLDQGLLTIRKTKAGQSRLVPLHPSTTEALRHYVKMRDRLHVRRRTEAFFVTVRGTALTYQWVTKTFRMLRRELGWATTLRAGAPRIHDLRHTFAVRVLLQWYQVNADIDVHIATLATYLGHVNVTYTYWYLTAVPELMAIGASRFETFAEAGERS